MLRRLFSIAWKLLLVLALVPVVLVPLYAFVQPVSTLMLWRWARGERVERQWRPLEAISPDLLHAVIAGEDARFCSHNGVDWEELRDALDDAHELSDVRGASTIAMQTAKNLFLWPGRHYVRKALEMPLAYYIGAVWSKRRLAEIYFNVAEWGPSGEFGAEAGALRAFRKSARTLSAEEAALLAAVLPNPRLRDAARPGPGSRQVAVRRLSAASSAGPAATACLRLAR
jgi:monofunctional biosynthetic peptidoglycan transglycosylase